MTIVFDQVKKNYGKKSVFFNLNFKIPLEPIVIGLVGPNGVGKSTMLRLTCRSTRTNWWHDQEWSNERILF